MPLLIIVFGLLGLAAGSFLNVCIDRLPQGQSIINPPSHCATCQQKLGFSDLVPLFSYIWLRGKCRYCRAPIPLRLPIVEGVTALMFAFLYWKFDFSPELGISLLYTCLLIIIFVIDLENQLILNKVTYPGMALALILSSFWINNELIGFFPDGIPGRLISSLSGGALGLVVMSIIPLINPTWMGWGDAKLAALVGLMVGFPLVIILLLMSWIIGGLVASILLVFRLKGRKESIPSGIFMVISTVVILLWGQGIWQWYLL